MKLGAGLVVAGIVMLSLVLAFFVAPHASEHPDGLEKVAGQQGLPAGSPVFTQGPMPDYRIPGITDPKLATGLAGVAGTLGVLAITFGIGKLMAARRRKLQPT
ncbi:MAG: PDGLE domain-containing protein [Planctomycetes bacterium]|nr:PDGLE domain-containing protein [Planctomycetota bacterium]